MIKKLLLALATIVAGCGAMFPQQPLTLEECILAARDNYPLIRKYQLTDRLNELSLSDIDKSWLPGISLYGQTTVQNAVPAFPDALPGVPEQMGRDFKGLGKLQYKAGIDMTQTIWDGGRSKTDRAVERASAEAQRAALDVELYAIRGRVEDLYFGILLMDEQIAQSQLTMTLLRSNRDKLQAMEANGVAMVSDVDMVEAQMLSLNQQITSAKSAAEAYRRSLEIFTGLETRGRTLAKPTDRLPAELSSDRPELKLFDARIRLSDMQRRAVGSTLTPKLGFFAQAYYGYPGFDYFSSMRDRSPSFNILAGVKAAWSVDPLYTRRNKIARLATQDEETAADRDVFLFNSRILTDSQLESIEGLRKVMADDSRIIELRRNVRKAAEAQLDNGVIDTTDLLSKITDENMATLTAKYHEIQLLKTISQLKTTLNR